MAYSIMTLGGKNVAGICGVDESGPSQWMSYLLVEDLEAAAVKATSLGATILKKDVEIPRFGRLTVVEDPVEAVFALWQSNEGELPSTRENGTVSWMQLVTKELPPASKFYCELAGWNEEMMEVGDSRHRVFTKDGTHAGGIMTPPDSWNAPHSFWLVYFAVDDCTETSQRCEQLGGKILDEPTQIDGVGLCAIVTDQTGGAFGIVQYDD